MLTTGKVATDCVFQSVAYLASLYGDSSLNINSMQIIIILFIVELFLLGLLNLHLEGWMGIYYQGLQTNILIELVE